MEERYCTKYCKRCKFLFWLQKILHFKEIANQ